MFAFCSFASAQTPNPVERKVEDPITDTPNVNPLVQDQPIAPRKPQNQGGPIQPTDVLEVNSDKQTVSGPEKARVFVYEGNVDIRQDTDRMRSAVGPVISRITARTSASRIAGGSRWLKRMLCGWRFEVFAR